MESKKQKVINWLNVKNSTDISELTTFTKRGTSNVKFNTSFVKFANLYAVRNVSTKYLIAFLSGFIMSILTVFLVEITGLYVGGTTAFFQGLARFFYSLLCVFSKKELGQETIDVLYDLMFWGFYLIVNIPLIIFAYYKLSKRFALLSIVYLISLQVCGFLWSLIPHIHDVMLFGDTSTVDENLKEYHIKIITFFPNIFPLSGNTHNFNWGILTTSYNYNDLVSNSVSTQNVARFFLLLVYAVIFSLFSSFFGSVMYMISGSTAGGDIVTIYFSQEKHKSLGLMMMIYNSIMMILGVLFGSYLSAVIYGNSGEFKDIINASAAYAADNPDSGFIPVSTNPYTGINYIISGNLIASFVWVIAHGRLVNRLFPWHKIARVEIFGKPHKITKINKKLFELKYTHPTTMSKAKGGFSKHGITSLVSIMQVIELPEFIQIVRSIDKDCLISTVHMSDIDGRMTVQNQAC